MTEEKQVNWRKLSKHTDLQRLMREFGCTNNEIADYPINDPDTRRRIGILINDAVHAVHGNARRKPVD
jgi:hypothetical protein